MKDLIEALQIFAQYTDTKWPTHCEHDILMIMKVGQDEVSEQEAERLEELGFHWSTEYDCWASFRFGSA